MLVDRSCEMGRNWLAQRPTIVNCGAHEPKKRIVGNSSQGISQKCATSFV